jgi:hypothetical protein
MFQRQKQNTTIMVNMISVWSRCYQQGRLAAGVPPVRESAPVKKASNCQTKEKIEIWSWAAIGCQTPRPIGGVTVGCKIDFDLDVVGATSSPLSPRFWGVSNLRQ